MEPKKYATAAAFEGHLRTGFRILPGRKVLICSVCGVRLPSTGSWPDCFSWDSLSRYLGY